MLKYKKGLLPERNRTGDETCRAIRKGLPERRKEKRVGRYLPEEGWKRAASDSAVTLAGSI